MGNSYRITAATGIHKGDRDYQQDQVAVVTHPRIKGCVLGVVSDGMGGRSGGRLAADQVVMSFKQGFERYQPHDDDAPSLLEQLANEAHTVIQLSAVAAEMEPHATVAAFILDPDGVCHWVHSGDSRIYHFRGDTLANRTYDHSYVQTLVEKGELTELQARDHPQSNILLSCLGTEEKPTVSLHTTEPLKKGDCIISCSDGLWHYFTFEELGSTLATLPPREAAEFLVEKARQRAQGGGDNLSLAILRVENLVIEEKKAQLDIPSIADLQSGSST